MPQLVRQEIGRLQLKDEVEIVTSNCALSSLSSAKVFNGGIIKIPTNAIIDSLQISTELRGPSIQGPFGSITTTLGTAINSRAGNLYQGNMCAIIRNWITCDFKVGDCLTLQNQGYPGLFTNTTGGKANCVRQPNQIGGGAVFKCDGDGAGVSLIFTLLRPRQSIFTFGRGILWLAYDVTVIVTGFVTSNLVQNVTEVEETICCRIIDPNSKILYGERPATSDLQSDFIETQLQACRVAENIIWQQNKVIDVNFSIPFRPAIRRGQTIRVLNPAKSIDFLGIIKSFSHVFNFGQASVVTQIQATGTEYIFRSGIGDQNIQDKVDLRS